MRRWIRTRRALIEDNRSLSDLLAMEREQHLAHLLDVIEMGGVSALQIGNVERVWPEALAQWRELARENGSTILIVCGAGQVHGVYPVGAL